MHLEVSPSLCLMLLLEYPNCSEEPALSLGKVLLHNGHLLSERHPPEGTEN